MVTCQPFDTGDERDEDAWMSPPAVPVGPTGETPFFPVVDWSPPGEDGWVDPRSQRVLYVGGAIDIEAVVARSADAAVAIGRMSADPDGFWVTVFGYLRQPTPFHPGSHPVWGGNPNETLRFGLELPDGRRSTDASAVVVDGLPGDPDGTEQHGLSNEGGGSSDGRITEMTYRAWPLPTSGVVTFYVEWRSQGIGETSFRLDAALLTAAAARAERVFPPG